MRRFIAVLLAVILTICTSGCGNSEEYIHFHDKMLKRAELPAETIEWLEQYNKLTEEEQLAISYIPGEVHSVLYEDIPEEADMAAEAGS